MTLQEVSAPATAAGMEAHDAIKSRRLFAERIARDLLQNDILREAKVILAGSEEFSGIMLTDKAKAACEAALVRLYPAFQTGDSDKWPEVFKQAKTGAPAPLELVNYSGDPDRHPVCKAILDEVGNGKKGSDLIKKFGAPPYGWPKDAVHAGVIVLMAGGLLRASRNGQAVLYKAIDRDSMGPIEFRVDHPPISPNEKVRLRAIYQKVGVKCQNNDEVDTRAGEFLAALIKVAESCGGPAPLPDTPNVAYIRELQTAVGNEQLAEILVAYDRLDRDIKDWTGRSKLASQRAPRWQALNTLLKHGELGGLPEAADIRTQADAILKHRQLLDPTDPVPPLCNTLANALRKRAQELAAGAIDAQTRESKSLEADASWINLGAKDPAARDAIAAAHRLDPPESVVVNSEESLLSTLEKRSLPSWAELITAIPGRFESARRDAAIALQPKAQYVKLPSATITTKGELSAWLKAVESMIDAKLGDGPVIL